jgi:glycopeptide antibiotics resistance protein
MVRALAAAAVVIVAVLLLWPHHVDGIIPASLQLLHLTPHQYAVAFDVTEAVSNVILFVPIGFLVNAWLRRPWLTILFGLVFSAACEFAQSFLPGRDADINDVICNTIGAGIGALLAVLWYRARARRASAA